ncbi:MAG: SEC-C domain-containing protein, partial [Clostridia bacterium]|nr:SEC-C domain-containing protein [Clostridia bacterium]
RGNKSSEMYLQADKFVRTIKGKKLAEGEKLEELDNAEVIDFTVNIKEKSVQITESGSRKAERFFGIENLGDIEHADLNHHIQQALKAHYIFKRDNDYIVQDNEIIIVDEFTGRLMNGRRYSEGLHQAIEAKEKVVVRNENQTQATITFQNYFRLYSKLSGMTGTAKTEEEEFKTIYGLDVLEIPTNKPVQRIDNHDVVYSTHKGKLRAIVEEIVKLYEKGQPVLVGTVTVEKSEEISRELLKRRVRHQILNAKNHRREAEIIAQAGKLGAVTIATNMAGRGTDILLGGNPEFLAKQDLRNRGIDENVIEMAISYVQNVSEEVEEVRAEYRKLLAEHAKVTEVEKKKVMELGGLFILGTERHESRRIDNQLRGRSGRQGDPGESRFYISLEDDLASRFGGERLQKVYSMFKVDENTPIEAKMLSRSIENAQRTIEGKNFGIRKHILGYDDVMNRQRMVMYEERMKVLRGESVHQDVLNLIPDYVHSLFEQTVNVANEANSWDKDALNKILEERVLPVGIEYIDEEMLNTVSGKKIIQQTIDKVIECYEEKIENYKERGIDYHEVERIIFLRMVDTKWIDHIDNMDRLKRGISLRGYANEDPLNSYKREGLDMFEEMTASIQEDTVKYLLKIEVERVPTQTERKNLSESGGALEHQQKTVVNTKGTIGRNDPCPCGSGKKYKNCCGR